MTGRGSGGPSRCLNALCPVGSAVFMGGISGGMPGGVTVKRVGQTGCRWDAIVAEWGSGGPSRTLFHLCPQKVMILAGRKPRELPRTAGA